MIHLTIKIRSRHRLSAQIISSPSDHLLTFTTDRHPALGGGYGSGFKVAGGHDFVGDNYTGIEEPKPDDDPLDCAGHVSFLTYIY
jgi:hypothetical protein